MLKVLKFGGSSMADAEQFEKVTLHRARRTESRRVVVVTAAGKRYKDDHKVTDLLYLCYAHLQYGVSCDGIYQMICDRYLSIRDELGLMTDLEARVRRPAPEDGSGASVRTSSSRAANISRRS